MQQICKQCGTPFEEGKEYLAFLDEISPVFQGKKYSIPPPADCPECRQQRRCAFRNERTLYSGTCGLCGKTIVSLFSGDRPFTIYCQDCWWGDKWDSETYGRPVDFSRPFFEQFRALQDAVPRMCLNNVKHENSTYCNQCTGNKNCYMLWGSDDNEDCMYGQWVNRCTDTYNASNTTDSSLCADTVDCEQCYRCIHSQDLVNCSDCAFCFDLVGCQNCWRCAGLRKKQYCIDNEQHTKEEYEAALKNIRTGSHVQYTALAQSFSDVQRRTPHKYAHIINAENCTGDYISNSKNCERCFDVFDSEDCMYAHNLVHRQYRNVDVSFVTEARTVYQGMSIIGENVGFSTFAWYGSNVWYSDFVQSCHNMFGCVGMKRKQHCILNKQYSEEEWNTLVPKLIGHMQQTGEWGSFFPPALSPYAYNETCVMDFFPTTKERALALGYRWRDSLGDAPTAEKMIPAEKLPDAIDDIPDDVLNWAILCEKSKRPFIIQRKELEFYRQMNLPIPRLHPDERLKQRMARRNPRKLWERKCGKCGREIQTTYQPSQPEKIYCEECYLQEVY